MIIGRDLMVQLVLMNKFNPRVLQWYGAAVRIKDPSGLLEKYLPSCKIQGVVMLTVEPVSARKATERMLK